MDIKSIQNIAYTGYRSYCRFYSYQPSSAETGWKISAQNTFTTSQPYHPFSYGTDKFIIISIDSSTLVFTWVSHKTSTWTIGLMKFFLPFPFFIWSLLQETELLIIFHINFLSIYIVKEKTII